MEEAKGNQYEEGELVYEIKSGDVIVHCGKCKSHLISAKGTLMVSDGTSIVCNKCGIKFTVSDYKTTTIIDPDLCTQEEGTPEPALEASWGNNAEIIGITTTEGKGNGRS